MIDREGRNALLAAIDDYLSGRIKTREFDDRVNSARTQDRTAREVQWLVWFLYDDLIDHPVKLNRQGWNYVQRLRLILLSDAEIRRERFWDLAPAHAIALPGLLVLGIVGLTYGAGPGFWVVDALLGLTFVGAMHASRRRGAKERASGLIPDSEMFPFQDFATMRSVYERTPAFEKTPYPRDMKLKPLWSRFGTGVMWIPWLLMWPMLALVGLATCRQSRYSVTLAEGQAGA